MGLITAFQYCFLYNTDKIAKKDFRADISKGFRWIDSYTQCPVMVATNFRYPGTTIRVLLHNPRRYRL